MPLMDGMSPFYHHGKLNPSLHQVALTRLYCFSRLFSFMLGILTELPKLAVIITPETIRLFRPTFFLALFKCEPL